jgi:hypothetical protein
MFVWLLHHVVQLIAWAITGCLRLVFRCFTMLLSHRFPTASLPEVELFTSLWLLTQAQYAWRHCKPLLEQQQPSPACLHGTGLAAHEIAHESTRPPPIKITPTMTLHPRVPLLSGLTPPRTISPETTGGMVPHRSVLVFFTLGPSSAQRKVLSERALQVMADASEMDLAILELQLLQASKGIPNLEETLDQVIADLRALVAHYDPQATTPNTVSTPTQKLVSFILAPTDPIGVVLCGVALSATVAMLALARRSPAMPYCRGVVVFDPFVGWAHALHARKVSFYDESFNSTDSDPASVATDSSRLVPYMQTPGRVAMPSIIATKPAPPSDLRPRPPSPPARCCDRIRYPTCSACSPTWRTPCTNSPWMCARAAKRAW